MNPVLGTVTTDASLCPRTRAMGWAVWIAASINNETKRFQASGAHFPGAANSSDAEFIAALYALETAQKAGVTHARLHCDNKHVVRTLGMDEYRRASGLPWPPAARHMLDRIDTISVRAFWVKGHGPTSTARTWVQSWCDDNARRMMLTRRRQVDDIAKDTPLIE